MIAPAIRALLAGLIDYAGLFPPAALSMVDAVGNYAMYRASPDAWALARFVVPVARLDEFERATAAVRVDGPPWRLSVLARAGDARAMGAFNARHRGRMVMDAVETVASTTDDVASLAPLPAVATVFVEIPVRDEPDALVAAIAAQAMRAKIRMGGVTADAFPAEDDVARFLAACARHGVMFKATAGLHHPLRGEYPLTYAAGAARHPMFGYLSVFLAASYTRRGLPVEEVAHLLDERDARAIRFVADGVNWRGHALSAGELAEDRARFGLSFGSCSFREPLDDLSALGLT